MTRTVASRPEGLTPAATSRHVPAEVWRHAELVGRLHALLSTTHSEARLPALLTVVHPHLTLGRIRPAITPPLIELGLVRQLSRLLGTENSPTLLLAVLDELAPHLQQPGISLPDLPPGDAALSHREVQVLAAMARGRTNAGIGSELGLSEDTVKTHARRIYDKLDARDRAHAVARGYQLGILADVA